MFGMLDPIIYFFLLGVIVNLLGAELRLPKQVYEGVSIFLLLAIGLKGGVELYTSDYAAVLPQIFAVMLLGFILPLLAYPILKSAGQFKKVDAACVAAHYGSVSVGTFAVVVAFLFGKEVIYEPYMPVFVVILEVPAILVGIFLAKGFQFSRKEMKLVGREVFLGKSVVLLFMGLFIGAMFGKKGLSGVDSFFFVNFKGMLAIFLLEMGALTAARIDTLKKNGAFLLIFGIMMPVLSAIIGALLATGLGMSVGGVTIIATLAASASYIAVPAAMRMSLPEANLSLALSASLGVTFPFNVIVGIPLYYKLAIFLTS